jgi:hypothetical protein
MIIHALDYRYSTSNTSIAQTASHVVAAHKKGFFTKRMSFGLLIVLGRAE